MILYLRIRPGANPGASISTASLQNREAEHLVFAELRFQSRQDGTSIWFPNGDGTSLGRGEIRKAQSINLSSVCQFWAWAVAALSPVRRRLKKQAAAKRL